MNHKSISLTGMACLFGPFFAVAQLAAKSNVVVMFTDAHLVAAISTPSCYSFLTRYYA